MLMSNAYVIVLEEETFAIHLQTGTLTSKMRLMTLQNIYLILLISVSSCKSSPNCVNYYSESVSSAGCVLSFLKISSAICCAIQINPVDQMYVFINLRIHKTKFK